MSPFLFADREYQCVGQWEEDGRLYTYAKRRDIPGYECFVGQVDSNGTIFLMEGGIDCKRGLRVSEYGMKLKKQSKKHRFCYFRKTLWVSLSGICNGILNNPSVPWFIPTELPKFSVIDREVAPSKSWNSLTNPPRISIISEQDIEDLSTKPWQPMTGESPKQTVSPKIFEPINILFLHVTIFREIFKRLFNWPENILDPCQKNCRNIFLCKPGLNIFLQPSATREKTFFSFRWGEYWQWRGKSYYFRGVDLCSCLHCGVVRTLEKSTRI